MKEEYITLPFVTPILFSEAWVCIAHESMTRNITIAQKLFPIDNKLKAFSLSTSSLPRL